MFTWNVGDWFYYNRDSNLIIGKITRIAGPTEAMYSYIYSCESLFSYVNWKLGSINGFSKNSDIERYAKKISAERAQELVTELKAQYL